MENDSVSARPKTLVPYMESPNVSPITKSSINVHNLATLSISQYSDNDRKSTLLYTRFIDSGNTLT